MESTLHRSLKELHGVLAGGRCEVVVGGFRIDAVAEDGTLVEVQSGGLGALKPKLRSLLPRHRIRVVRPVVLRRLIVKRDRPDGPDVSRRRSPKVGSIVDVFDDLVGLACHLSDPNLSIDLLGVAIEEVRVARRRGFAVVDRRLEAVVERISLGEANDLWHLLPLEFPRFEAFTTADLARKMGRSLPFAQKVAYCLRLAGAAESVGKRGNSRLYRAQGGVALVTCSTSGP